MNDRRINVIATLTITILLFISGLIGFKINASITPEETKIEIKGNSIELSEDKVDSNLSEDLGEVLSPDLAIPTVESVDGGRLEDVKPEEYNDLGSIESVDTSSLENFVKSVLNRCIIANNRFGAQCVSLARAFWWDYAGYDVSTCGTGIAKGMMNCADDNAKDKFTVIWNPEEIIAGTWIVTGGSVTGHICQALGKPVNGYVTCLGENQGGHSCGENVGGSATNIINLSLKNFIGGYIPNSYIPEPEPESITPPDTGKQ